MINQADDLTSGAIGVISHPLTVQVINQGPGIWGNVATGLITAGAAIAAVMLTHRFTLHREKLASEKKLAQERLFISTELVFMLEQFAESCASVATDWGYENQDGISVPQAPTPVIDYSTVTGDWRALPGRLMYQVRGLTVLKSTSDRIIDDAEYYPPDLMSFSPSGSTSTPGWDLRRLSWRAGYAGLSVSRKRPSVHLRCLPSTFSGRNGERNGTGVQNRRSCGPVRRRPFRH
ncbi:hypothetical protein [Pantoea ananatis]|uniref:hypothetical protein n=1 Tax=Pantoea ananas TaxID=553 RepID=UPI0021E8AF3F|nr:hypothetical protein [Pantoea ananatis]MCW0310005.1 hypothetical protein [Pantoea ananatis]MCW0341715.1 hypothetical protein [Pantoea ananatis]MCW0360220.1 hypothetical protein [Pantoea ananatis]MCW0364847.1 hypothetical protein [Pantoea ananatis]MCW1777452.1 hypothetical protein [Pantoea ananatis]